MISSGSDQLARTAYEAHRAAQGTPLPPWEEISDQDRRAWRAAVSAVAAPSGPAGETVAEGLPTQPPLVLEVGGQRHRFHTEFTAGRQGKLVIGDEYASGRHAQFGVTHGLWYVRDLGSTNGTWLNGRRINAAQWLRRGDKIAIGHTLLTVVSV